MLGHFSWHISLELQIVMQNIPSIGEHCIHQFRKHNINYIIKFQHVRNNLIKIVIKEKQLREIASEP